MRTWWAVAGVVAVGLALALLGNVPASAHRVLTDLEYAKVDGRSLTLDLYLPDDPIAPVPLVLWVHGGAWKAGDKSPTYAPELLGEAYAVASVNYRFSQEALFPAQIHDVKAAVRFLRGNAERFGLDPDRFGAWGSSAGGHLVALLGTSCGVAEAEGTLGEHDEVSSCVQAVCDFFGPTDFLVLLDQRDGWDERRAMPEEDLLGGSIEENVDLATLASPISHVDPSDPPFLILHGSEDPTVPVEQSIAFDEALRAAGVESTLIVIEGAGHGFPRSEMTPVKPFFDAHFLGASSGADPEGSVRAIHRSGQTFVTWPEGEDRTFAVYRTDAMAAGLDDLNAHVSVAVVDRDSALNARAMEAEGRVVGFVIEEGASPLEEGNGLFVETPVESGTVSYAVVGLSATGTPVTWIGATPLVAETVDTPEPILQGVTEVQGRRRAHYVHWAPAADTGAAQALCNRPGYAFNFIVWEPVSPEARGAALFALHGGGGSYANARAIDAYPDLCVVGVDSHIPDFPRGFNGTGDAWYGYNDLVGTGEPLADGLNVDYTTRRLRWMAEWLPGRYPHLDPERLFLRGSSMGGVGTAFSAILLRDAFAAGLSIVPRFDYVADDLPRGSIESFEARWGPIDANVLTTDGIGVADRLNAGFLAQAHPEWDFAPVWVFNGRNDTVVGWSEKIPFYAAMNASRHGWAFFWDERAHGGQSPYSRAWRENGTEDAILGWMLENIRRDAPYPAFANASIDDDPGDGNPEDGDPIGTINGYLRWDATEGRDTEGEWSIELYLSESAPAATCTVDVTPRRTSAFRPAPGTTLRYKVRAVSDGELLVAGTAIVDGLGLATLPAIPLTMDRVRLTVVVSGT